LKVVEPPEALGNAVSRWRRQFFFRPRRLTRGKKTQHAQREDQFGRFKLFQMPRAFCGSALEAWLISSIEYLFNPTMTASLRNMGGRIKRASSLLSASMSTHNL